MIFGQIKMVITLFLVVGIAGAGVYVMKLRADNEVLKANQVLLEQSVESQKQVIAQQKQDFDDILKANKDLQKLNATLNREIKKLDDKFNKTNASGKKRDLGDIAIAKPKVMEKIINKATVNATRCVEVAMGAPLTQDEINATKKSQINSECPSLVNPNYVPYN